MKIPKSIKVGGHTYEVKLRHNLVRDTGDRGCVTWRTQLIEIDDNMVPSITATTFIHEVIHVADKHFNNDELCENATNALAEGLNQVLSDMGITFEG